MGYPTEIPNAIPNKPPVPVRDPVTRLWLRILSWWNGLRERRKTRLADRQRAADSHPQVVGQNAREEPPALEVVDQVAPHHPALDVDGLGFLIDLEDP